MTPILALTWPDVTQWLADNAVPLAVTGAAIAVAIVVSTIVARHLTRRIGDPVSRHKARRTISYIAQFVALGVIGVTWASSLNFQVWIGLVSAGLALALQNVVLCLAGWVQIAIKRPFDIGDRIEFGNVIGDVLDVRLFHTYVLEIGNWVDADQSTGRVAFIPNSYVFTRPLFNYTKGFPYIWNEMPVLVTFESDWRKAKQILQDIVDDESEELVPKVKARISLMSRDYPIRYEHLTPIVYTSVRDSGVLLTIRHVSEVRSRRLMTARIWERILDGFAREPTVAFAYPTYRGIEDGSDDEHGPGDHPLARVPLPANRSPDEPAAETDDVYGTDDDQ